MTRSTPDSPAQDTVAAALVGSCTVSFPDPRYGTQSLAEDLGTRLVVAQSHSQTLGMVHESLAEDLGTRLVVALSCGVWG